MTAFAEAVADDRRTELPRIVGGRYGLASKEFTPAMVKAVFDNLAAAIAEEPLHGRHQRRRVEDEPRVRSAGSSPRRADVVGCIFYGLGADGTVGANKNSIKIIGEQTSGYAQGFFVYDSKKSGSQHDVAPPLRTAADPIDVSRAARAVRRLSSVPVRRARRDARRGDRRRGVSAQQPVRSRRTCGTSCRARCRRTLVRKHIRLYVIDADRVAAEAGMAGRINTIMQTCFFAISGVLPRDEAIARIKDAIEATYARKGKELVEQNFAAVDRALENLHEVSCLPAADQHPRVVSARARARAGVRPGRSRP